MVDVDLVSKSFVTNIYHRFELVEVASQQIQVTPQTITSMHHTTKLFSAKILP